MRSRQLALAVLLLAIASATACAQVDSNLRGAGFDTPANPVDAATTTIHVYSRETVLDVLVTDDNGQPVRGLKRSDFTILEDDHRQPIRGFSEYDKNRSVAPAPGSPASARTLPPNTYSNARPLLAGGPVQILYIGLPCPPLKPAHAVSYVQDYLRTMPQGTQVAIFGFRDDIGLRLVQDFTTDGPRAAASIDNLVLPPCGFPSADPIAAANQLAAYVAGVHGRKNLIWIGSPLAIMRDGGQSWTDPKFAAPTKANAFMSPDMIMAHRLMDLYDRFTQEQIAIYPFDPTGVQVGDHALNFGTLRAEEIATGTGGEAIYNTNDFKGGIAKIVDDTNHYYTLSYVPTRPDSDGHFHPIKIAVDHPHVHLVYRGGYNDEQPAPPDNVLKVHMNQASMGLGSLPSTQIVFNLQAQPTPLPPPDAAGPTKLVAARRPLPESKAGVSYDLLYTLDPAQLPFTQSPDQVRHTSVEFDAGAYDSHAKLVAVCSQTLTLALTPEEYVDFVQTPFKFYLPIDLPTGPLTLRAGIFDGTANHTGTLEIPLTVAKP